MLYPRTYYQEAHDSWKHKWNDQQDELNEIFINQLMTSFEQLLDVWPFHLIEVIEQGHSRFWLTCLEKECLQSLGLGNLFTMSWPKPDCHPSAHGTLLKRYEEAKALEIKKKKEIKKKNNEGSSCHWHPRNFSARHLSATPHPPYCLDAPCLFQRDWRNVRCLVVHPHGGDDQYLRISPVNTLLLAQRTPTAEGL